MQLLTSPLQLILCGPRQPAASQPACCAAENIVNKSHSTSQIPRKLQTCLPVASLPAKFMTVALGPPACFLCLFHLLDLEPKVNAATVPELGADWAQDRPEKPHPHIAAPPE
jgi:hypothetical protein